MLAETRHEWGTMRNTLKRIARWIFVGSIGLLFFGVGGEWLIHVAEDKGFYENAGEKWDRAVAAVAQFFEWLSAFTTSKPMLMALSGSGGAYLALAVDRKIRRKEEETAPALASEAVTQFAPVTIPSDNPEFSYPYRKAVLQVVRPRISAESDSKGEILRVSAALIIENHHGRSLERCSAVVTKIKENGVTDNIQAMLRKSDGYFTVSTSKNIVTSVPLIKRNLTDKVSKPPFLIPLIDRDYPLKDNTQYILDIELRSAYEFPTKVAIQVDTKEEHHLHVTLLGQVV